MKTTRAAPLAVAAVLVLGLAGGAEAAVSASIPQPRVAEGDPVILNITTNSPDAAAPISPPSTPTSPSRERASRPPPPSSTAA